MRKDARSTYKRAAKRALLHLHGCRRHSPSAAARRRRDQRHSMHVRVAIPAGLRPPRCAHPRSSTVVWIACRSGARREPPQEGGHSLSAPPRGRETQRRPQRRSRVERRLVRPREALPSNPCGWPRAEWPHLQRSAWPRAALDRLERSRQTAWQRAPWRRAGRCRRAAAPPPPTCSRLRSALPAT